MNYILLKRDLACVNELLSPASSGTVTLLGDEGPLLAASPLIRSILADTGLHPAVIWSSCPVPAGTDTALSYAADILTKGEEKLNDGGIKGEPKNSRAREKNIECSICLKACRSPAELRVHMRKHAGEKPFKCDVCQYSAATSTHIIIHQFFSTKKFIL